MPSRTIIVCANGGGVLADRLALALTVATRLSCDIDVLAFRSALPPPPGDHDFIGMGTESQMETAAFEDENAAIDGWKVTYDQVVGHAAPRHSPVSSRWIDVAGPVKSTFPSYARACDIIVAGGRSKDPSASTLNDEISSMALLESGRLALFAAHPAPDTPNLFAKILIAWDDRPAVARAIAQAIPLIAAAASVCLLVVEANPQQPTPCNSILAYLRRHAPNTEVRAVTAVLHTVGHTILAEAESWGASLIIMGAYEHSRDREIIFGGTTRFVVEHAKSPVLMAR